MLLLFAVAAAASLVLLALSVYPGVLVDFLFLAAILWPLWLPALLVAVVIFRVVAARRAGRKPIATAPDLAGDDIGAAKVSGLPWRKAIPMAGVVLVSLVLVRSGLPRRCAFALSRPAFERQVAGAPESPFGGKPLGRRLGVYRVDQYAADPRGGVYFRTYAGADGIGPGTMSYGFAFRPNRKGTPFGDASYRLFRISGDWYGFTASDD